jgi:hypothetical protein
MPISLLLQLTKSIIHPTFQCLPVFSIRDPDGNKNGQFITPVPKDEENFSETSDIYFFSKEPFAITMGNKEDVSPNT